MVKWNDEEERIRNARSMIKRKSPGSCKICQKTIEVGEECFYYEVNVNSFAYPVRRYICKACHSEVSDKPHESAVAWLINYYGEHPVD